MIFGLTNQERGQRDQARYEWEHQTHRAFAWLPVRLYEGNYVWLQHYTRKWVKASPYYHSYGDGWWECRI